MSITAVVGLLALCASVLSATPCKSGRDCSPTEVCEVHYTGIGPIGRRQPIFLNGGFRNTCVALRQSGESCWVSGGTIHSLPTTPVQHSPCQVGLTCVGKHLFVVPDGEVGECR